MSTLSPRMKAICRTNACDRIRPGPASDRAGPRGSFPSFGMICWRGRREKTFFGEREKAPEAVPRKGSEFF